MKQHTYTLATTWTGNDGQGTQTYQSYRRDHEIQAGAKPPIFGSSDPAFRGDPSRYSPEELFVAALSSCHMLWYLHLCATHGIVVLDYRDEVKGRMRENKDGSGEFEEVTLHPVVRISRQSDQARATSLHTEAHRLCFIARSVNFPVNHIPVVRFE